MDADEEEDESSDKDQGSSFRSLHFSTRCHRRISSGSHSFRVVRKNLNAEVNAMDK